MIFVVHIEYVMPSIPSDPRPRASYLNSALCLDLQCFNCLTQSRWAVKFMTFVANYTTPKKSMDQSSV